MAASTEKSSTDKVSLVVSAPGPTEFVYKDVVYGSKPVEVPASQVERLITVAASCGVRLVETKEKASS